MVCWALLIALMVTCQVTSVGCWSITPAGPQSLGGTEGQEGLAGRLVFGFLCKETSGGVFATISLSIWGKVWCIEYLLKK